MGGGYDDRVTHNYSGESPKTLCNNISQDFLSGSLFTRHINPMKEASLSVFCRCQPNWGVPREVNGIVLCLTVACGTEG